MHSGYKCFVYYMPITMLKSEGTVVIKHMGSWNLCSSERDRQWSEKTTNIITIMRKNGDFIALGRAPFIQNVFSE